MLILKEQVAAQTFKFMPRSTTADTMTIKEEGSNASTDYDITVVTGTDDYFSTITEAITLREGFWYTLTVKNGSTVIYKDRIYCTNQTVADYSITNSEFTQQTTSNDYIIID